MTDTWSLRINGFDPGQAAGDGSRLLCANGYMGLRGAVEEADSSLYPAVTLAGVYDRNGEKWREPVNAPNALFARLSFNGTALHARSAPRHSATLDYRHGIYSRDTDFGPVRLRTRRFASMAKVHLLADQLRITAAEDGEIQLVTGLSIDIWDINGPHLFDWQYGTSGPLLRCNAVTGEKHITVAAAHCISAGTGTREEIDQNENGLFRVLRFFMHRGEEKTVSLFAAVYTSLDGADPADAADRDCLEAAERGFDACLLAHRQAWEEIWSRSEVTLESGADAVRAMHAAQYHLLCAAPRHAEALSIPARALSGQTYKGAIFWDSEIFFFPMFVHTQPETARSLLRYRIRTLPGALRKAREYGFRGAFYAWESQEGGLEGCTDFNVVDVFTHRPVRTYFRDKQIHISADIAYALRSYYDITGDTSLLEEGGARVILECARFYLSRACCRLDSGEISFEDVIGPDEYHERVTNNAFTNRMIRHCLESALDLRRIFAAHAGWFDQLLLDMDYAEDWKRLQTTCTGLRGPRVRCGVIEQFDGYFDLEDCTLDTVRSRLRDPREYWGGDHGVAGPTQIIKQADVMTMLALFPDDHDAACLDANWSYYEPRTEHGSSLSACMYALTACRAGRTEEAWRLFMQSASIDIIGGGKQWAGEVYIGGTHPAAGGGAWMIAVLGFAGLRIRNGQAQLHPCLPEQVTRLSFPFICGGQRMRAEVTRSEALITPET